MRAGLDGRIAAILDDGPCAVGLESTILGLQNHPTLLREGGVTRESIEQVIGTSLDLPNTDAPLTAPGQLQSHYAPNAKVRLNAKTARTGELNIGSGAGRRPFV